MASEIRVNKINSQTGVGTITLSPTGVDISGITTAATLKTTTGIVTTLTATTGIVTTLTANTTKITTGIVTTLTATTGIVTTLTTNTLTANSTAKVGSGVTLSPDGDVFTTGITTSSTVIVGSGVTISESGIEASGIGITCANINGTQIGGRRNIIINGAMEVAQHGTSSTSDGVHTVDRINKDEGGTDESVTQSQVDVASGTTPYTEGFRKAFKLTNGNQTSGAGVQDYTRITYKIEAQDLSKCGWNYTSTSSFVTLQFWIKSSVAQNFYFIFNTADGGQTRSYVMETGSLSAGTWTKITKTFPGDSQLVFNNDTGIGCYLYFYGYLGTNYTDNSVSVNAWKNVANPQTPVNTTTWWTTNDATLEMTGLQLEVGSQATPFEHRSFNEELALCQRYYQVCVEGDGQFVCFGDFFVAGQCDGGVTLPVEMRTTPSLDVNTGADYYIIYTNSTQSHIDGNFNIFKAHKRAVLWYAAPDTNRTAGHANRWITNNASAKIAFDAEL